MCTIVLIIQATVIINDKCFLGQVIVIAINYNNFLHTREHIFKRGTSFWSICGLKSKKIYEDQTTIQSIVHWGIFHCSHVTHVACLSLQVIISPDYDDTDDDESQNDNEQHSVMTPELNCDPIFYQSDLPSTSSSPPGPTCSSESSGATIDVAVNSWFWFQMMTVGHEACIA